MLMTPALVVCLTCCAGAEGGCMHSSEWAFINVKAVNSRRRWATLGELGRYLESVAQLSSVALVPYEACVAVVTCHLRPQRIPVASPPCMSLPAMHQMSISNLISQIYATSFPCPSPSPPPVQSRPTECLKRTL